MKMMDVPMKHAGYKPPKLEGAVNPVPDEKESETQFPFVESFSTPIPGMEDLEPGKEYVMLAHVIVRKKEVSAPANGEKKATGKLDILDVGFKPYSKKKISDMNIAEVNDAIKNGTETSDGEED